MPCLVLVAWIIVTSMLTEFCPGESTLAQRAWIVTWVVVGSVAGPFIELLALRLLVLVPTDFISGVSEVLIEAIKSRLNLEHGEESDVVVPQYILFEIAEKNRLSSLFWLVARLYGVSSAIPLCLC